MFNLKEFSAILGQHWPELDSSCAERLALFYQMVVEENQVQNLTRLVSPFNFAVGHVLDVKSLLDSKLLEYPCVDVGSGAGVPGIVAAIVDGQQWTLIESEGRKAAFLQRVVGSIGLERIHVKRGRVEEELAKGDGSCLVFRAVGPLGRLFNWLQPCSTWNTAVLMKGKGWQEEWKAFQAGSSRSLLVVEEQYSYKIPTEAGEAKERVIVRLRRVGGVG